MESIVFQDSPLAQYLEGEGEADNEWAAIKNISRPATPSAIPSATPSFAPPRPPLWQSNSQRKLPNPLILDSSSNGMVAHVHQSCSSALHSRLGWIENAKFLEEFRYIIVASQLLSDIPNPNIYDRQKSPIAAKDTDLQDSREQNVKISWLGLLLTSVAAFASAYSIHWLQITGWAQSTWWRKIAISCIGLVLAVILYAYFRQRMLHNLREQAVESASSLTTSAQSFDAAASETLTLIQEVEVVSRGYRISNPFPPVTRLDEQSQTKRCTRLRRSLCRALKAMISPYYQAYQVLRPLAVDLDLEKYYDIYEISRTDMDDAEEITKVKILDSEGLESLKSLKMGLQNLHMIRKLFLCSLLALEADGGKSDFSRWAIATETMKHLSLHTTKMTSRIDEILRDEEDFPVPPTPKLPLTPSRERMRNQMRKLGSLSQGIRGLQAKMHLLRDESDVVLNNTDEISQLGPNLLSQYDSIGEDLKTLLQEWENGRTALALNIDKNENRKSMPSTGKLIPLSPTPSLGGSTAVEGSPPNGLLSLHGFRAPRRSRSSTGTSSSGEEVFEAVAFPRQRSTLTREERLVKMKEDRMRQAIVKGKSEANAHMLRELETVIKLRPRGRTTGRMTSI